MPPVCASASSGYIRDLYDGTMEYEEKYLQTDSESPGALFVIARHDGRVIGVSTGVPLAEETEEVQRPFREAGIPVRQVFTLAKACSNRPIVAGASASASWNRRANPTPAASPAFAAPRSAPSIAARRPAPPARIRPAGRVWDRPRLHENLPPHRVLMAGNRRAVRVREGHDLLVEGNRIPPHWDRQPWP